MKAFRFARQGELRFVRLPNNYKIPASAVKVEPVNDKIIVGYSETGHHHVMEAERTMMYRLPDLILDCLLVVDKPDTLKHLREFDTHEPLGFTPGTYKVTTGREYVPEGWRRSAD